MKIKINKELEITILVMILFLVLISTLLNHKFPGILAIFLILSITIYKLVENEKVIFKE